MNRNQIKVLASVSMFVDHFTLLVLPLLPLLLPGLFPLVGTLDAVGRGFGRLAMPLYAFFIGEGCRYTKNRRKYFLSVFLLGVGCQLVYILDELIETGRLTAGSGAWYMNILLCFSAAIPGGCLLRDVSDGLREKKVLRGKTALLFLWAGTLAALGVLLPYLRRTRGWGLEFDYGVWAILLAAAPAPFQKRAAKLLSFSAVLLLYCLCAFRSFPLKTPGGFPLVWLALLSLVPLLLYNGKPGSRRLKYGFYVFYPAHLGFLYLAALLIRAAAA